MNDGDRQAVNACQEGAENESGTKAPLWKRVLIEIWPFLVVPGCVYLLFTFILILSRIPSGSMENTIMTGDRIIGSRTAYRTNDPERFDIVIFRYPDDPSRLFVKRVIGLPGETVELRDGKVYIDGSMEPLADSFCPEKPESFGDGIYVVPEGHYFLLGDNRNNSNDSRFWDNKYVAKDAIVGKAGFRVWPVTKLGTLRSTIDSEMSW